MLDIRSPNGQNRFGYALCGLGPAGCGFLLHAIKEGAIDRLVDDGLVIIDRAAVPGSGKLGHYRLTGNSLSRAFLDCIDDPKLDWLFHDLRIAATPALQLRSMEYAAPPLDVVGDFLTLMMTRTLGYLSQTYNVPVQLETSVETIRWQANGLLGLDLRDMKDGGRQRLQADNVLCGFGGRQDIDVIRSTELLPGVSIGDHVDDPIASDDFLMMSDEAIREAIPLDKGGEVLVVGSSDNTMSSIDRLTEALGPVGLRRITMLYRDKPRLYYASAGDAQRDGYVFDDPVDVCAMSGRINRFGGLRYRSFDVAKSIVTTGKTPDQSIEVVSLPLGDQDPAAVSRHLTEAAAVITCLGYQANIPPVVDPWDRPIALQNTSRGLEIDDDGCALAVDGRPIAGLFVYGLGSRLLKRSDAIGGEPSFAGSADGVWLYHHHGGGVILNALRKTWPNASGCSDHTARRASHVRLVK